MSKPRNEDKDYYAWYRVPPVKVLLRDDYNRWLRELDIWAREAPIGAASGKPEGVSKQLLPAADLRADRRKVSE